MNQQVSTFIYGSCVSRDTFEFLPEGFSLEAYVARQSYISTDNEVTGLAEKLTSIDSAFQRRVVHGDVAGDFARHLEEHAKSSDIVLLDLVDERGGVIDFGGERFATRLAEFWSGGGSTASEGHRHVRFGSDEHFELWKAGAARVVGHLLDTGLFHRTAILKTDWAESTDTGESYDIPDWMTPPAEANEQYSRYFHHLRSMGLTVLELPAELARTTADHKWGISPFHYANDAYEYMAQAIQDFAATLTVPRTLDGLPRRNTARWGVFQRAEGVDALSQLPSLDGYLTVIEDGLPIDLWVDGCKASTTLVVFSSTVGGAPIDPPVFPSQQTTDGLHLNRVFIADPGLACSPTLGVAWHLGTREVALTKVLSSAISAIQQRLGAQHLVFHGANSGGFAAMNVGHEFPESLVIPINPQTRILDYTPSVWAEMAHACYGTDTEEGARALLDAHPRADLRRLYADGARPSVLYMQANKDPRISTELIPWFDAIDWGDGVATLIDDWSGSNGAPLPATMRTILEQVAAAEGDWPSLMEALGAHIGPTREWVRATTGR